MNGLIDELLTETTRLGIINQFRDSPIKQLSTLTIFTPLTHHPILHVSTHPELEGNINGPSLVRVPDWVNHRLGRYYLYFGHHAGRSIRLAYADHLTGPWTIHRPSPLTLADSYFSTEPPNVDQLHPQAKAYIAQGIDGTYPHIASPDVIIDRESQTIRLYYHGRLENGLQMTRVALSKDGLLFKARPEILGQPYMRVFQHQGEWIGIAMPGILYRSKDGLTEFEEGPNLFEGKRPRHFALWKDQDVLHIFWTEIGDRPEQILSTSIDISPGWVDWRLSNPVIPIRKPELPWEGSNLPIAPSKGGAVYGPVNQLRDPDIFAEDDRLYLLYSVAGEQGIAIGELMNW